MQCELRASASRGLTDSALTLLEPCCSVSKPGWTVLESETLDAERDHVKRSPHIPAVLAFPVEALDVWMRPSEANQPPADTT